MIVNLEIYFCWILDMVLQVSTMLDIAKMYRTIGRGGARNGRKCLVRGESLMIGRASNKYFGRLTHFMVM